MPLVSKSFSDIITFSRGSNATYFDSAGVLKYAPNNLLLQSEDFSTTWTNANSVEQTDVAVAPDGTLTADLLQADSTITSSAREFRQNVNGNVSAVHTVSVFAKVKDGDFLGVSFRNQAAAANFCSAEFNLSTGAISVAANNGGNATGATASITPINNGWYRCSVSGIADTSGTQFTILLTGRTTSNNNSVAADTELIYVWGAQLNIGDLQSYYPTQATAYYGPRFDYNPSTLAAQGLLIEEQRTNITLYSTLAGAVAGLPGTAPTGWSATAVGTPTLALPTSIYGSSDQAIACSGTSGDRLYYQQTVNVVDGTTYTFSAYCEASSGSPGSVLSVINGTSTVTVISTTASNPAGGAGVRVQVVFSVVGTGTVNLRFGLGTTAPISVNSSFTLSRPQCEAGAFPTSYIPTTTTALTRAADVASVNTLSPWYNQAQGTFFCEFNTAATTFGANLWETQQTSTSAERIEIGVSSAGVFNPRVVSGGAATVSLTVSTYSFGTTGKIAFAIQPTNYAASFNSATPITSSDADAPTTQEILYLGCRNGNAVFLNGYLRRITYYPRRLSNAELVSITS